MADSLDSAISSAVETAVTTLSDSSSPPVETPATTPDAGQTPAPTADAGKAPAAPAPSSTDAATKRPSGKAAKPQTDPTPSVETSFTLEKHEQILKNARAKEREAVSAELRNYGLDLADRNALENIKAFTANPAQYVAQWIRHYQIPAEQIYGRPPAPTQATPADTMPEPDLQAEDGTPAYSAKRMTALLDWRMKQVEQSLTDRLTPFEADRQRAEQYRIVAQVNEEAKAEIAYAAEHWEAFTDLKPRIHELMKEDGRRTLSSAYALAIKEHWSTLKQTTRESVLKEIKQTPAAPTDVAPTVQTRAAGKKRSGFDVESAVANAFAKVSNR